MLKTDALHGWPFRSRSCSQLVHSAVSFSSLSETRSRQTLGNASWVCACARAQTQTHTQGSCTKANLTPNSDAVCSLSVHQLSYFFFTIPFLLVSHS